MKKVLILGGYGNFGKLIATALVKANISIIIAGRSQHKSSQLALYLQKKYPYCNIEQSVFNVKISLSAQIKKLKPSIIINTVGPFQNSNYDIAKTCIKHKVHYIDLADGRDFVANITKLDSQAKTARVVVISGASTVPCLSSAVIEEHKNQFLKIDSLVYGISPGQKSKRGLATTKAILTYIGRPLKPALGHKKIRYGWQDIYLQKYPQIGARWMANCEIPDLDLLPKKYNIKEMHFSAGMESTLLHLSIWLISWLVRLIPSINLPRHAGMLLKISNLFDVFGTKNGGMHVIMRGKGKNKKALEIKWYIIATNGDGPHIPTIPAIILAKKLIYGDLERKGAYPCVNLISLADYLKELESYNIKVYTQKSPLR